MPSKQVVIVGTLHEQDGGVPTHPIVIPPDRPNVPDLPGGIWGPTDPRPSNPIANVPGIDNPNRPGFGLRPEHPIVLPPLTPSHPIVIPDDPPRIEIWPPLIDNSLPEAPPVPTHPIVIPPDACFKRVYSMVYGWALVQLPKK